MFDMALNTPPENTPGNFVKHFRTFITQNDWVNAFISLKPNFFVQNGKFQST